MESLDALFSPMSIGRLEVPNRFVRAGTAETMATDRGEVSPRLIRLYERLARGGIGLIVTGHMFVHPRGRATHNQTGIHEDSMIPGLRRLTERVHEEGGRIFVQLGHAGPQSRVVREILSPGLRPNPMTGRTPSRAASVHEIEEAIHAFGKAAGRAVEAGFDGVHIHAANGYLISSFASPYSNQREDPWGGSAEARSALARRVVAAVTELVPSGFPVTMKLGFGDATPDGVDLTEAVQRAAELADLGIDAVEVSSNLMSSPEDSARKFVAVDRRRARADLIFQPVPPKGSPEAYFLPYAKALRARAPGLRIVLVGGIRSVPVMRSLVQGGLVDLLSLSRPFIREPDLLVKIASGRQDIAACTSCNICFQRAAHHSLRCWRKPRYRLAAHAALRLLGR